MSSFALLLVAVVGGAGVIVGALFRWWGVLAPVGFTVFLMYGWEFYGPAVTYAVIIGGIAFAGVVAGALIRRRLS